MRLYLSSYQMGNYVEKLLELVGLNRRVAIIENAQDFISTKERNKYKNEIFNTEKIFQSLDFETKNLDLRQYFNNRRNIETDLKNFGLIWVCGGNVFLLRRAMQQSKFDIAIKNLLAYDKLVYGGYSAGICILSKTLTGLEICDDPLILAKHYNSEIIWNGLDIIDYSIAPHYRSDHHESDSIENVVNYFEKNQISYVTLKDGNVILYDKDNICLLKD